MIKLIKVIFVLSFLNLSFTYAGEWKVSNFKNNFLLKAPNGKSFSIQSVGGVPKFLQQEDFSKQYIRVIYSAGTAGTSQPINVQRALLIDKKGFKFVKDLPYKYIPSKGTTYSPAQPEWKLAGKVLKVIDKEFDENLTVKLK